MDLDKAAGLASKTEIDPELLEDGPDPDEVEGAEELDLDVDEDAEVKKLEAQLAAKKKAAALKKQKLSEEEKQAIAEEKRIRKEEARILEEIKAMPQAQKNALLLRVHLSNSDYMGMVVNALNQILNTLKLSAKIQGYYAETHNDLVTAIKIANGILPEEVPDATDTQVQSRSQDVPLASKDNAEEGKGRAVSKKGKNGNAKGKATRKDQQQ